jgi:hypothetical protein
LQAGGESAARLLRFFFEPIHLSSVWVAYKIVMQMRLFAAFERRLSI